MEPRGLIFDIERFAIHDGPGIRTTLFLKGCPLACWWCHNPESLSPRPQLAFFSSKCIGCGRCFDACPNGVHEKLADGGRALHREKCVLCGRCVQTCFAEALVIEGREITVDRAMEELRKDRPFYESSGGGITLSGGEPMRQPDFSAAVLAACHKERMHTALDTSGYAPWEDYERVLPFVDLVLYDFKLADPEEHRRYTGVSNELIRENLARIDAAGVPMEIRIPLIPGINDGRKNIEETAGILAERKCITRVTLLPYHGLGETKYPGVGRSYRLNGLRTPSRERMEEIAGWISEFGLAVLAR
ncbi:MAG: glycyl-radical enzyme activating protein [Spirochaetia bacterium]|jgi:pyruvate formate lyase activating enzyme